MSLASQFRNLGAGLARFRRSTFGEDEQGAAVSIIYNHGEHTVAGYYSPFQNVLRTEEAGYIELLDGVVRIPKPISFVPERKKHILIQEVLLNDEVRRIELIIRAIAGGHHPVSAEWVLECEARNAS